MKGKRLDTIFLDFAKEFNKFDFAILLEKPKSIKSIVKLETGCISEEETRCNVLSSIGYSLGCNIL